MFKKVMVVLLVFLNLGCDQFSKVYIRKTVTAHEQIQLINDNFILTNVENTGAMLGMGSHLPPVLKLIFLQGLPILVLLVLLVRVLKKPDMGLGLIVAFAFVIGGGIGNLIDRVFYGKVTDFFFVKIGFFKTGIFNMADVSVTLGVLLLLGLSLLNPKIEV